MGVVLGALFPIRMSGQTTGPLRVHPSNPRYFADGSGRPLLLAGSHTWATFFDQGGTDPPPAFNITQFLNFLQAYGHNFTRTFVWEQSRWGTWTSDENYWLYPGPPYKRTGPGTAEDGKLKFNLDSLNQSYFNWIRNRVDSLNSRGVYCSVQFFDGWSVVPRNGIGNPWRGHPFKAGNNVNGINGDPNDDNAGEEIHSLNIPEVWPYQERYIKKLIDELNEFNNIIWEVSNESSYNGSDVWELQIIDTIRAYELRKPKQHPIGFTADWLAPILNGTVFASTADWVSPGAGDNGETWKDNPPDSAGSKVVLNDTDHLWGNGGDAAWVWKSFLRGNNVLYMDGYDGAAYGTGHPWTTADSANPEIVKLRKNLGYILQYSRRIDLALTTPHNTLSSSGYCLAHPVADGAEYLVFLPGGGSVTVDLSSASGSLDVEWFNPAIGNTTTGGAVLGGSSRNFTAPFAGDAVLYVHGAVKVRARVKAFLEGPYDTVTSSMKKTLNTNGTLSSRFPGVGIPSEAVDSITIELRSSSTAAGSTTRKFAAAWLLRNGTITTFTDTTKDYVEFDTLNGSYYLVVWQRNHLPVMTLSPQYLNSAVPPVYDFTASQSAAYGTNPMQSLGGIFAMVAGDVNQSGIINAGDRLLVRNTTDASGYNASDINIDGVVNAADRVIAKKNTGFGSQVP